MSDIGNEIQALIKASGKSAPQMTHALKRLGSGDMQSGIKRIASYLTKEGIKIGTVRGTICGVIGTAAVGSLILLIREAVKAHQSHKAEGVAILKELNKSLAESENNKEAESPWDVKLTDSHGDDSPSNPDNPLGK